MLTETGPDALVPTHASSPLTCSQWYVLRMPRLAGDLPISQAPLTGVTTMQTDITCPDTVPRVLEALGGRKADLVVCDGAPDGTYRTLKPAPIPVSDKLTLSYRCPRP